MFLMLKAILLYLLLLHKLFNCCAQDPDILHLPANRWME